MNYAPLGACIVHSDDLATLAENFAYRLRQLLERDSDTVRKKEVRQALAIHAAAMAAEDEEKLQVLVEDTFPEVFSRYCAPYAYFGQQGDDYGIFPAISSLEEDVGDVVVKIDAGEEWAGRSKGFAFVMEVNDHGNVALFATNPRRLLWDCV